MGRPKSEIRVKQRADTGAYIVAYVEDPGRWHATPAVTRDEALRWARRNRDRLLKVQAPPLKVYADSFFARSGEWVKRQEAKGHHFGDAYLAVRRGHVDNYIVPLWGDLDPAGLSERQVDDDLLAVKAKHGGELAGATKNKIMYSLGLILGDLAARRIIAANPLANIRPYSKTPAAPRGAIPREALAAMYPAGHQALVRVWGSSLWAAMMLVFNDTGLRPGEIRALRWREWFSEDRFFPVRHGVEAGSKNRIGGLKTEGAGARAKPAFVSIRTAQELEIWRAESRHSEPNDFIFSEDGAHPLSNTGIVKAFRRGIRGLDIDAKNWTPYWLRHSFGTYSLEALGDEALFALMGHTNLTTANVYRHPDDLTLLRSALAIRDKLDASREPGDVVEFKKPIFG